jgi:hypothetical protein
MAPGEAVLAAGDRGGVDHYGAAVLDELTDFSLGHSLGGFRGWWRRWHDDSDEELDNTHLMRMAGRFARRVAGLGQRA